MSLASQLALRIPSLISRCWNYRKATMCIHHLCGALRIQTPVFTLATEWSPQSHGMNLFKGNYFFPTVFPIILSLKQISQINTVGYPTQPRSGGGLRFHSHSTPQVLFMAHVMGQLSHQANPVTNSEKDYLTTEWSSQLAVYLAWTRHWTLKSLCSKTQDFSIFLKFFSITEVINTH